MEIEWKKIQALGFYLDVYPKLKPNGTFDSKNNCLNFITNTTNKNSDIKLYGNKVGLKISKLQKSISESKLKRIKNI